jgi:predicted transcriptional regulator
MLVAEMVMRIKARFSEKMFLNEKIVDLYIEIRNGSLYWVCKQVGVNYAYAHKMVSIWENLGLIYKRKTSMKYNILYTDKGQRVYENLLKTKLVLKRGKIQWDATGVSTENAE